MLITFVFSSSTGSLQKSLALNQIRRKTIVAATSEEINKYIGQCQDDDAVDHPPNRYYIKKRLLQYDFSFTLVFLGSQDQQQGKSI